jgi:hypothetical protein
MNKSKLFMAAILLLHVAEDSLAEVFIHTAHSFKTFAEKQSAFKLNGVMPLFWLKNRVNKPNDDRYVLTV